MAGSLYGVEKMVNFDFVTDQTRKAVKYTKYAFFKESDCSSKSIYEVETVYDLKFLELFGDTTLYNRTLATNKLILTTKEGIQTLGCNGLEAGASLDLMSQEESSVLVFTDV